MNGKQSAKKAADLRAKFEQWEEDYVERAKEEDAMPSLDTAKNLKKMFETKATEGGNTTSKPIKQKVNRFVVSHFAYSLIKL